MGPISRDRDRTRVFMSGTGPVGHHIDEALKKGVAWLRRNSATEHMLRALRGGPSPYGPQLRLDLGGRDEARYSPPNPAFKTWNNCPPNFTVQDGLCKPYRGR